MTATSDLLAIKLTPRELKRCFTSGRLVFNGLSQEVNPRALPSDEILTHDLNCRRRILQRTILEHDLWLEHDPDACLYEWN